MGRGEPEWTDEDRSWALALIQHEDDTCHGCGQPLSESTAIDSKGLPVHKYVTDDPDTCWSCVTLSGQVEDYSEHSLRGALKFRVIKSQS